LSSAPYFCSNCGASYHSSEARWCTKCGRPLSRQKPEERPKSNHAAKTPPALHSAQKAPPVVPAPKASSAPTGPRLTTRKSELHMAVERSGRIAWLVGSHCGHLLTDVGQLLGQAALDVIFAARLLLLQRARHDACQPTAGIDSAIARLRNQRSQRWSAWKASPTWRKMEIRAVLALLGLLIVLFLRSHFSASIGADAGDATATAAACPPGTPLSVCHWEQLLPKCKYGLEGGGGPLRCADANNPNSSASIEHPLFALLQLPLADKQDEPVCLAITKSNYLESGNYMVPLHADNDPWGQLPAYDYLNYQVHLPDRRLTLTSAWTQQGVERKIDKDFKIYDVPQRGWPCSLHNWAQLLANDQVPIANVPDQRYGKLKFLQ